MKTKMDGDNAISSHSNLGNIYYNQVSTGVAKLEVFRLFSTNGLVKVFCIFVCEKFIITNRNFNILSIR